MKESFLHYLWQMQYFNKTDLKTKSGEKIEVFRQGNLNADAGPDFANARIRIGAVDWVGSVEIHIHSSGWYEHHHEKDKTYENVILHVVWQDDKPVYREDKTSLPTLELKDRVNTELVRSYRQLVNSAFSIPCRRSFPEVDDLVKISMVEKALMQRLERKAEEVLVIFRQNGNHWEQTLYQLLARNFGFKINGEPFFQLAQALPLKLILKHSDRPEDIEALLFGQAGFLEGSKGDDYYLKLKKEYKMLAGKYDLLKMKMSKSVFRFLRMRPANFPTLRLAQLAAVLGQRQNLFSHIVDADNGNHLIDLLNVSPSPYWLTHYQFSKKSTGGIHELGIGSIHNIIINTIVPLWAAYAKLNDDPARMERALSILQEVPPEQNKIIRLWEDIGYTARHSLDTQGLIEIFNGFCSSRNCLSCNIGAALIRP